MAHYFTCTLKHSCLLLTFQGVISFCLSLKEHVYISSSTKYSLGTDSQQYRLGQKWSLAENILIMERSLVGAYSPAHGLKV